MVGKHEDHQKPKPKEKINKKPKDKKLNKTRNKKKVLTMQIKIVKQVKRINHAQIKQNSQKEHSSGCKVRVLVEKHE